MSSRNALGVVGTHVPRHEIEDPALRQPSKQSGGTRLVSILEDDCALPNNVCSLSNGVTGLGYPCCSANAAMHRRAAIQALDGNGVTTHAIAFSALAFKENLPGIRSSPGQVRSRSSPQGRGALAAVSGRTEERHREGVCVGED